MYANIKEQRQRVGMTQAELAAKVNTSQGYISAIELGLKTPSLQMLARLADAMNVSPTSLIAFGNDSRRVVTPNTAS